MKLKSLTLIAVAAVGLASTRASAQFIPVTNGSFEEPATASYTQVAKGGDTTTIPGWNFNVTQAGGVILASVNAKPAPGDTYGGVGATGSQIAFLNIGPSSSSSITSAPITTIAANTNYLASVAVGNDPGTGNYNDPGQVTLNLLANSTAAPGVFTVVSTKVLDTSTIPDDAFENFTVSLTATQSTLLAGDSLKFQMVASNPSTVSVQPVFDNVTLEAPEPTTWAFLLGGLSILALIQRRRLTS